MDSFEKYLIRVGIRSSEFTLTDKELFDNIDYFKKCYLKELSAYKALLFLIDELEKKPNYKMKTFMKLQEAYRILSYHQQWRLGKVSEMKYEPKVLSEAIYIILNFVQSKLTNVNN